MTKLEAYPMSTRDPIYRSPGPGGACREIPTKFYVGGSIKGGAGETAFWLPILALHTGARLEELGHLMVSDIGLEGDNYYIHINIMDEGRHLKNSSSHRKIPLYNELKKLKFLDYVEDLKELDASYLFPELKRSCSESLTGNWSK